MSERARLLLTLSLIPGLGARRINRLLEQIDRPEKVLELPYEKLRSIHGIGPRTAGAIVSWRNRVSVETVLRRTRQIGARILTIDSRGYPPLLRTIHDPPCLLWVKGAVEALSQHHIAVIGTRSMSRYGKQTATAFSASLATHGLGVVSGLAMGIDTEAHRAVLEAGGTTVAVLGSGMDHIYPAFNRGLARDMAERGGAVISEYPPGTKPEAGNFPVRNRVVSGLSLGVLVVETRERGGSMITAATALEQNREVFVIPHALNQVSGEGGNKLIREGGGKLVQSVEDIFHELPVQPAPLNTCNRIETQQRQAESGPGESRVQPQQAATPSGLSEAGKAICSFLRQQPGSLETIACHTGFSPSGLMSELVELECRGCIRQRPDRSYELL